MAVMLSREFGRLYGNQKGGRVGAAAGGIACMEVLDRRSSPVHPVQSALDSKSGEGYDAARQRSKSEVLNRRLL
jgi:hypothetical protein